VRVIVWVEVKAAELPRDELDRGIGLDIENTELRADLVGEETVFLELIEGATKIVVTVVDGRVETKGVTELGVDLTDGEILTTGVGCVGDVDTREENEALWVLCWDWKLKSKLGCWKRVCDRMKFSNLTV
jgi:hypothetical protein